MSINQESTTTRRRYVPDEVKEETENGNLSRKNTQSTKDWVSNNKITSVFIGLGIIIAIMVMWRFSALFVTVLTNIWLYVGIASVLFIGVVFYMGRSSYKTGLRSKDKIDIDLGSTAVSYEGKLEDVPSGKAFYPIIDKSFFGMTDVYMKIKDVSPKLTDMEGVNKSPDDKIAIYIPDDVSKRVDETPYGTETFALGSKLEPKANGGIPRLQLKRPDTVGEDSYNKLRREYYKLEREYNALEYELRTAEVEAERATKKARKKEENITKRKHQEIVELLEATTTKLQHIDSNSDSGNNIVLGDNND